jgi:phosphatidylserine decarboxylase
MAVCVGAIMAGSIHTTVKEEEHFKHGQEFGYFAFGMYSQIESLISSSDT